MRKTSFHWFACLLLAVAVPAGASRVAATGTNQAQQQAEGASMVRLDPALDAVIAPGTRIERVATGFKFTEGPMWKGGRLWFSDLVGDQLISLSPGGQAEVLIKHSGGVSHPPPGSYMGSNAMVPAPDGTVLLVQQGGRRIVRLDSQRNITPFLDRFDTRSGGQHGLGAAMMAGPRILRPPRAFTGSGRPSRDRDRNISADT